MVRELTAAEVDKALRNLEKIEAYLSPRTGSIPAPECAAPIASMWQSVSRLEARLRPSSSAAAPEPSSGEPTAMTDAGPLDAEQLASFATYLDRLERWCAACDAVLPRDEGSQDAQRLVRRLDAVRRSLESIESHADHSADAASPPEQGDAGRTERPSPGRRAGGSAAVDDVYDGAPRRAPAPAPAPARQIAMTTGDIDPMFQWVGPEEVELTARAREQIEQLFAEQGISYFRYQLENFAEEVRRRIRSAPEGHVLVIKVREIGGERKPFLSYVAESTLRDDAS